MKNHGSNFPKPKKRNIYPDTKSTVVPNKVKPNRLTPRNAIIKLAKVKEKFLKEARGKKKKKNPILYKGTFIRISVDFSTKTSQTKTEW